MFLSKLEPPSAAPVAQAGLIPECRVTLFAGVSEIIAHIDATGGEAHFVDVKQTRAAREPKTKGTLIVEAHRPAMNKLTDAERRQLRRTGIELINGRAAAPQPARRASLI